MNLYGHYVSLGTEKDELFNRIWMIRSLRVRLISDFHNVADESHFVAFFIIGYLVFVFATGNVNQIGYVLLRIEWLDN